MAAESKWVNTCMYTLVLHEAQACKFSVVVRNFGKKR